MATIRIKKMRDRYESSFLRNDAIVLTILYCLGLSALHFSHSSLFDLVKNMDTFYASILTISSGLFVFLITSVTILISFLDNKKLHVLKDTKHPEDMLKTFFSGIKIAGIEVLCSLLTGFFTSYERFVFYVVFFFFLFMSIRVLRILWILYNLAKILIIPRD